MLWFLAVAFAGARMDTLPHPWAYPLKSPLDLDRCLNPGEVVELSVEGGTPVEAWAGDGVVSIFSDPTGRVRALLAFDMESPAFPRGYQLSYRVHGRLLEFRGTVHVCPPFPPVERIPRSGGRLERLMSERILQEKARFEALFRVVRPGWAWSRPFSLPVPDELVVTGRFGARRFAGGDELSPHTGVDLRARWGTPILAVAAGVVSLVDRMVLEGNVVVIDHGGGLQTLYAHLDEVWVSPGRKVVAGSVLGLSGKTGRARGAHLHFSARLRGARVDPLSVLRLGGVDTTLLSRY
ncbi:MAG: M23 family metallopeptidase [Nitrospirae bacterium]|nr:M23 family metallopeptidase [Nitrospirota bacterium]